jgi:uncharacterized protein (DUF433 family)
MATIESRNLWHELIVNYVVILSQAQTVFSWYVSPKKALLVYNRCQLLLQEAEMHHLTRITFNPQVMGGKPCIRGMRVTVGTMVGLVASGKTVDEVLADYPYLEPEDILEALSYAAWRAEEREVPIA